MFIVNGEFSETEKNPQINSIQELAQFWDLHDLTDFEDELEEVDEPVFQHTGTIPLIPEDAAVSLTTPKEVIKTK